MWYTLYISVWWWLLCIQYLYLICAISERWTWHQMTIDTRKINLSLCNKHTGRWFPHTACEGLMLMKLLGIKTSFDIVWAILLFDTTLFGHVSEFEHILTPLVWMHSKLLECSKPVANNVLKIYWLYSNLECNDIPFCCTRIAICGFRYELELLSCPLTSPTKVSHAVSLTHLLVRPLST